MKRSNVVAGAVVAGILLAGVSYRIGAQGAVVQTSGTVHVSCMSDGSLRETFTAKP